MKYFFIGIGGIGMSALAELLKAQGHEVRGSDVTHSGTIERLIQRGISVQIGHEVPLFASLISSEIMVINSAISETNPLWLLAKELGCQILRRGELLAEFVNSHEGLVVAGSHGKTTTSSMLAHILEKAGESLGFSPSFAIGGRLMGSGRNSALGSNLGSGRQNLFVAEGDESDASFLKLRPKILAITNIDADHMSTYGHSFEVLIQSFVDWILNLPEQGVAVLNHDDGGVVAVLRAIKKIKPDFWETRRLILMTKQELLPDSSLPTRETEISRRLAAEILERASFINQKFNLKHTEPQGFETHIEFEDLHQGRTYCVTWPIIGEFNAINALMAGAMAHAVGVDWQQINQALCSYPGVERRMQYLGNLHGANFFEDYGHHPAEIRASLMGLRAAYPTARLVQVFQPHRYTRTRDLWDEFVDVLGLADVLILLPIYAASEPEISGITASRLFTAIQSQHAQERAKTSKQIFFVNLLEEAFEKLSSVLKKDDLIVLHGAGDMPQKLGQKFKDPTHSVIKAAIKNKCLKELS